MEKWWLLREDFKGLVTKIWKDRTRATKPLDRWQEKIRKLRKITKGWSSNEEASIRRYKRILLEEFNALDVKAESSALSTEELARIRFISSELQKIWLQEEVKAGQRSRDRDIKEGDRNTSYFHAVANQRNRKVTIHSLDGPDGPVTDTREMLKVACDFYKDLFKKEPRNGCKLSNNFFREDEKVKSPENDMLEAAFTEAEIKKAVFDSYADGAPGPDGIPFFFYQHFWDLVKDDLVAMFNEFH